MTQSVQAPHLPVMVEECLAGLDVTKGRWYIDGTFGAGGHTRALLAAGARVLAIDQDPAAKRYIDSLKEEIGQEMKIQFVQGNFRALDAHARAAEALPVSGVLLDIGVSSMQLDEGERGFAFRQDGPLDMRMNPNEGESAADVVNTYEQDELAALIYKYGEERHSRRVARGIVEARAQAPLETTEQLSEVVQRAYPGGRRRDHPARRTFQALRIAVNDELGALEDALHASERVLEEGGRLAVLCYHSLEDRIVKHFLRGSDSLTPLTKRPLTASDEEVERNPRARSAKLRVAEKIPARVQA